MIGGEANRGEGKFEGGIMKTRLTAESGNGETTDSGKLKH